MNAEFAVRDGSGTGQAGSSRCSREHPSPRPPVPEGRGTGTGLPHPPLSDIRTWLEDVRRRGCTMTVTDGVILVRGRAANDLDRHHNSRYRHALETAAAGTHTDWWNVVLGRTDPHPDIDLPGTYHDPACACCGAPALHLDHQLLPWCDTHHQEVA